MLPRVDEQTARDAVDDMGAAEALALLYDWKSWARPSQLEPVGDWLVWLLLAGRGFGKTRVGAETVRARSKTTARIALVGPTAADTRDVMIEGESGILACSPPHDRPSYEPSKRRLTWANGAMATAYSADEPERLRGPQHGFAWADELAAWRYPEAWDQLMFGLRLGSFPQVIATTTPKPRQFLRQLASARTTHVTRGSTYENMANLPEAFRQTILSKYEGTTMGRQEIYAELLTEVPGALWRMADIDRLRVALAPTLRRVVVGVDPAATSGESSDETGIVVDGIADDGHGYTLEDCSLRGTPDAWAREAVRAYHAHKADIIVAEANNGGEMVSHTIHTIDKAVPVKLVHASRGKRTRAEPISALYEQGKWHHVGIFPTLEDQQCNWVPGEPSPDHMDAHVWAATELVNGATTIALPSDDLAGGSRWA